ncbi:MAG TPA: DNA polymerase III subunit beta [Clostridiales bacterium]|nr:DNA polymerase III subunit beta [Clostridiales bacterium]
MFSKIERMIKMKFVCYKDKIMKALNSVVKGVASKTTMPILEGILIQTNDNEIKLTTYDLELGIEYKMECDVQEQGSIVVNATMFTEIIRKLPDSEINISLNENNLLTIDCEGALYKLATMNPDEFPELPKIEVENSVTLEQSALKNMIRKTIFAVSQEETRPIFTGCLFEINNNKLNIVAIDGFRLALRTINIPVPVNDFKAVIPAKTLNEVNKILTDSFDSIKIGVSKNQAVFEMENCKVVTRILDGEFLNYSTVIPTTWQTRIRVERESLLNSFERISLIASSSIEKEKKYPVKVTVDIGKLTISCTNQTGDAKEEVFISTEGQNLEVGFNPRYFLDSLKAIDEEEIYIEFGTNVSPCLIKSVENNDYVYMILPIRLKGE